MSDFHWLFTHLHKGETIYCAKGECVVVSDSLRGEAEKIFTNYVEYINEYHCQNKHIVWMDEKRRICVRRKKPWELI